MQIVYCISLFLGKFEYNHTFPPKSPFWGAFYPFFPENVGQNICKCSLILRIITSHVLYFIENID